MSKKIYAALLPVLAVLAFAGSGVVATGAAQAANPHWFACNKLTTETGKFSDSECQKKVKGFWEWGEVGNASNKLQVISFGKLTLTDGTVEISCKVLNAGNIWNLAAGGLDEIEVFLNYECVSLGTTVCSPVGIINPKDFPWPTELLTGTPPTDKVGTVAKPIEVTALCGAMEIPFKGTLSPKVINPTETEPLHFEFTAATGELEGPPPAKAKVEGNVRLLGFLHGEQLKVE